MHTEDLLETVRTDHDTALSRLGSSKSLFSVTAGDMEPGTVLATMATEARLAADLFDAWAGEAGGALGVAFEHAAETVADQADAIAGRLDDFELGSEPAILSSLGHLDDDVDRAGGLLGWVVVATRRNTQVVGYFTGQADPQTASLFRGFGEGYDDVLESVGSALEEHCGSDQDWVTAENAAAGAVEAAYDAYTETLESMGVNPKPVC